MASDAVQGVGKWLLLALRRALAVLLVGTLGVGIWALFHFVVSNESEFLDYLRVLVWPLVVLAVLSVLRGPIMEKVRQLLQLDAFGVSTRFAAEPGRTLERDLKDDLEAIFVQIEPPPSEQATDEEGDEAIDVDSVSAVELAAGVSAEIATTAEAQVTHSPLGEASSSIPDPVAVKDSAEGEALAMADLVEIATTVGVPTRVILECQADGATGLTAARAKLKASIRTEATRNRMARNQAVHRQEETRESVESVIRKSAAWGYEMGRAGAPEAVPDIEWNDDGSWSISTEVPKAKPAPKRTVATVTADDSNRQRQIKALEDEIKGLEQKKYTALGTGFLGLNEEGWLRELKRRLRSVDPGSPWAR